MCDDAELVCFIAGPICEASDQSGRHSCPETQDTIIVLAGKKPKERGRLAIMLNWT